MRRNEVTGHWQFTAQGPSCVTAPPGLLILSVLHWLWKMSRYN